MKKNILLIILLFFVAHAWGTISLDQKEIHHIEECHACIQVEISNKAQLTINTQIFTTSHQSDKQLNNYFDLVAEINEVEIADVFQLGLPNVYYLKHIAEFLVQFNNQQAVHHFKPVLIHQGAFRLILFQIFRI